MRMRLLLSSSDEHDRAVRGAGLAQAQHAYRTGVAAGDRPFFVGKGELKAAFRTRAVDQPDITRGSKAKLGAVMSSNLPVVVSRGQDEVLRRRLDCLAVHHKARPLALIELGSARVKPMLQRRGWPA